MDDTTQTDPYEEVDEAFGPPPEEDPQPRAPVQVDPDRVEEFLRQEEVLEQTIRTITEHAKAGGDIATMAGELTEVVRKELFIRRPDGSRRVKDGLEISKVKQMTSLLGSLAGVIKAGNATYRLNRGLYDSKSRQEVTGPGRGDRFASFMGFALRGAGGGAVAVSEGVAGGQEQEQDLGGLEEDRKELSRSN